MHFGGWTTHTALQQSQTAGQDAELRKLALHPFPGNHPSRTGEGLPGAVVSPLEFKVIGHTLLSPNNMFVILKINKEERYSRVPRLSDTLYTKGNGDMQAAKRD